MIYNNLYIDQNIGMLLNKLFNYVIMTCNKYKIDESHGLGHSMNVLYYTDEIINSESKKNVYILEQKNIIHTSAILHDMCDNKYINEKEGIESIKTLLKDELNDEEINVIRDIITLMSYSKVKINGFPNLGKYQLAYHIVREEIY